MSIPWPLTQLHIQIYLFQWSNSVKSCIILGLLLLFSLFLFTLFRLYLEIRDIWRPGAGLAGTQDSMAQIRDIPGNPGLVATIAGTESRDCKLLATNRTCSITCRKLARLCKKLAQEKSCWKLLQVIMTDTQVSCRSWLVQCWLVQFSCTSFLHICHQHYDVEDDLMTCHRWVQMQVLIYNTESSLVVQH